jgi:hypothetical protein
VARRTRTLIAPAAWPEWIVQRRRFVRVALIVLLVAGPILAALVTLLLIADRPTPVVLETEEEPAPEGLIVRATLREIDPFRGEMAVQLVVVPDGTLNDNGRFAETVTLLVNDAAGATVRTFDAGAASGRTDAVVALDGTRPTSYPFDSYDAGLFLVASTEGEPDLPLSLTVTNGSTNFVADVAGEPEGGLSGARFELRRPGNVIAWVVFLAAIWWALAIASIAILWQVVMWHEELQFWIYGFLIGVLFALPPLRDNLPGAPPRGSLIDYAAFYWAVGIVALCLVLSVLVWTRRLRRVRQQASH